MNHGEDNLSFCNKIRTIQCTQQITMDRMFSPQPHCSATTNCWCPTKFINIKDSTTAHRYTGNFLLKSKFNISTRPLKTEYKDGNNNRRKIDDKSLTNVEVVVKKATVSPNNKQTIVPGLGLMRDLRNYTGHKCDRSENQSL